MGRFKFVMMAALLGVLTSNAYAQVSKVQSVFTQVNTVLMGASAVIFTLCIGWAGYKMAFQSAKWQDISNIIIGGIMVGGAAGIASWLVP